MKKYIAKRFLLLIPTFIGITMITYGMVRFAPGDYTTISAGMDGGLREGSVGQAYIEQERKLYGLDKPVYVGYVEWFAKFVTLDMGTSRRDGRAVTERIAEALPITLTLNVITIIIVYIISIPLGIAAAVRRDSIFDRASSLVLFILYSLPAFWVGLILLMLFSSGEYLDMFPLGGWISDWAMDQGLWFRVINVSWHLVLPIVTLVYGSFAFLARFSRANMLEVLNQQYITTARAKGLRELDVVIIHAFRNSLVPLVTLMASLLPGLLGGSVIVESIFSIPGMGMLAFESILARDIPVIMAITSISALLTLVGILAADLLYAVVDPRIRLEDRI